MGLIPGSRRCPGGGHGHPYQYSCLGNPMDRGAWQATVHGVAKSWTWLVHTFNLWRMWQDIQCGEDNLFNKQCWKKLDSYMQKNQNRLFFNTKHKDRLKMDERLKCKMETMKLLEEKLGGTQLDITLSNIFGYVSSGQGKHKQRETTGLRQTENLPHSEGNHQQTKSHLLSGRRYLQMVYPIRGYYPKYAKNHTTQYK